MLIIQFLINAGKKAKKEDPHALGLPQGSVRAILSISLIIFFILIALFFYFSTSDANVKSELSERILTILGTLVIAVSSFYFGIKATEQGSKIANDTFKDISDRGIKDDKNVPPNIILEAIAKHKESWKQRYNCEDVKLGKKKSTNIQFEINCIQFYVRTKMQQLDETKTIPDFIEYTTDSKNYKIPTDVVTEQINIFKPKQNFGQLSQKQQYEIIESFMESNAVDKFLNNHPSVTGVSAAKKEKDNNTIPLICIQFQVAKKINSAKDPIPSFILFSSYHIPTDVVESGPTEAAFSHNSVIEGISRLNATSFGSLGFPVYFNNEMHILSCFHVLFDKELNQGELNVYQADSDTTIVSPPYSNENKKIGHIVQGELSSFLDIAIMKPTAELKKKYETDGFSKEIVYLRRDHENGSFLEFYGSKSQSLKKRFILDISTVQPIKYSINGRKQYKRLKGLIKLEKSALKGDSGAALYDYKNRIAGIIVAVDDKHAYAVSAYSILKKTNYSLIP